MKKCLTILLLSLSLSACNKFGQINSDKVVGVLNQEEIHKVAYGLDSLDETTLYIPIKKEKIDSNVSQAYINKKLIDQYAHTAIYQYEFKSRFLEDDNLVYVPNNKNSLQNENAQVFDDNHHFKEDGVIGTYVLGQYHLSIHKMANFWDSDRLYVAIQDDKVATTSNIKEDNILGHYNDLTIHQLIFSANSFFGDDQYIYIAVNPQKEIIPLTNLYTESSKDTNSTIRSALVLMNKYGKILNFNE